MNAAIVDMVNNLMDVVASDARSPQIQAALLSHYQSGISQLSLTPTQALQSTFVVACLSPSLIGIGM